MKKKIFIKLFVLFLTFPVQSSEWDLFRKGVLSISRVKDRQSCTVVYHNKVQNRTVRRTCRIYLLENLLLLKENNTENILTIQPEGEKKIAVHVRIKELMLNQTFIMERDRLLSRNDIWIYYYRDKGKKKLVQIHPSRQQTEMIFEAGKIEIHWK